jgi:hypothetical protein
VGLAASTEGLLDLLDLGDIQPVVGDVAGDDHGGDGQAQGIEDSGGDLELGPGGVVLAVTELDDALLGDDLGVGAGGGGIDAEDRGGQVVDAKGVAVEIDLERQPVLGLGQGVEDVGEPVIVEVEGSDGLAQDGLEGEEVLLYPR